MCAHSAAEFRVYDLCSVGAELCDRRANGVDVDVSFSLLLPASEGVQRASAHALRYFFALTCALFPMGLPCVQSCGCGHVRGAVLLRAVPVAGCAASRWRAHVQ